MAVVSLYSGLRKVPGSKVLSCSLASLGSALALAIAPGFVQAQELPAEAAMAPTPSDHRPLRAMAAFALAQQDGVERNGAGDARREARSEGRWGSRGESAVDGASERNRGWSGRSDQVTNQPVPPSPAVSQAAAPVPQASATMPSWNSGADWRSRTAQGGELRQGGMERRDNSERNDSQGAPDRSQGGWQGGWRNRGQSPQPNTGWTTPVPSAPAAQAAEPSATWSSRSSEGAAARGNSWNGNSGERNRTYTDPNRNRSYTDPNRNEEYRDSGRDREGERGNWEANRGQDNRSSTGWAWGNNQSRDWNSNRDRDRDRDWRGNNGGNGYYGRDYRQRGWNNQWRGNNSWNGYYGSRYGSRSWDHDWRRSSRYDWYGYRDQHRNLFRMDRYYSPYRNYSYRRLSIGFYLDSLFFGSDYIIDNPWRYRLPDVYGPYRWVRYYDDALLIDTYSGQVVDVVYDFFW